MKSISAPAQRMRSSRSRGRAKLPWGTGSCVSRPAKPCLGSSSGKVVNAWFSSDDRCLAIKQEETPDFYTLEFYDLQGGRRLARLEGLAEAEGEVEVEFVGAIASRWSQQGNDTFWSRSMHLWPRISLNGWWRGES